MRGAKVGTEVRPFHSPARDCFDPKRQLKRAFLFPGHVFMHPGVAFPTQAALKLGDGKGENWTDIGHALDCMPLGGRVNPENLYSPDGQNLHDLGMDDIWPRRVAFRNRLEEFLKQEGMTQKEFAEKIGISLSHLRNCLYREDKKLGIENIQRACAEFKCSIVEFVDDPGAPIGGQDMSNNSEQARFFGSLILKDVAAEDLTDDDRQELFKEHQRAVERIRAQKARIARITGADRTDQGQVDSRQPGAHPIGVAGKRK